MTKNDELVQIVRKFEEESVNLATGSGDYEDWEEARNELLSQTALARNIPEWVIENRHGSAFWDYMKSIATGSGSYTRRRLALKKSLSPVYKVAEQGGELPISKAVDDLKKYSTPQSVTEAWNRMLARRTEDPAGCITAARSMLESVCKYILEERKEEYTGRETLPQLYKKVATVLQLAPEQHQEDVFKQILGGCGAVVGGFAALRNKLGDAHGKSATARRPAPRHADLAINLAGAIASFLIQTHEEKDA